MRNLLACAVLLLLTLLPAPALAAAEGNVILLTLDGVRWQEMFHGTDPALEKGKHEDVIFRDLFRNLVPEGAIFGDRTAGSEMRVANSAYVSLPAYMSILSGRTQSCKTNSCDRIGEETVNERLVRELGIPRESVATIASWEKIERAAEHQEGATFVNVSTRPLLDPVSQDPETDAINRAQAADLPPWKDARFDRYTFAHGMNYLRKHRPRFMFLSLNDSDEWGHKGDYPRYIQTLHQYDAWITELVKTLEGLGEYGRETTLIITTDHGRGETTGWTGHGILYPSSKYIWLYGRASAKLRDREPPAFTGATVYTHLDLRPTIEAAIGVPPHACRDCGQVIREIVRTHL